MYIAMDCETGGIDPAYSSLLTATLQMLDEDFEHIMTLELKIKHSIYLVSAEALAVNKIDLLKHHAEAIAQFADEELAWDAHCNISPDTKWMLLIEAQSRGINLCSIQQIRRGGSFVPGWKWSKMPCGKSCTRETT